MAQITLNSSGVASSGTLALQSNGTTTAVTIDASQNVGIGTGSPSQTLHLKSETSANAVFEDTTSGIAGYVGPSANNQTDTTATRLGIRGEAGISFSVGSPTKMTLDASGNLGIGTTSPRGILDISKSDSVNAVQFYLENTSTSEVGLRIRRNASDIGFVGTAAWSITGGGSTNFGITGANELLFATGSTERARIDSSGNLLVGTTSQIGAGLLNVKRTSANNTASFQNGSDAGYGIAFYNVAGSVAGSISWTATTTTYSTSSDYRLKEVISPMTGALDKVALLKPVTYKWKVDGSDGEGFIAHELAEVCPNAVTGAKDAVNEDGSINPQGIDVSFLVATLTAAIQELNAKFEAYKASHP